MRKILFACLIVILYGCTNTSSSFDRFETYSGRKIVSISGTHNKVIIKVDDGRTLIIKTNEPPLFVSDDGRYE